MDRIAERQHKNSQIGGTAGPRIPELRNQCVPEEITTRSDRIEAAYECALDLIYQGQALDDQEPRYTRVKITLETLGVDVSPHLFRTAAASTAATYGGDTPHLASALLGHTDPRVTEEHYNRATSITAAKIYAEIMKTHLEVD